MKNKDEYKRFSLLTLVSDHDKNDSIIEGFVNTDSKQVMIDKLMEIINEIKKI